MALAERIRTQKPKDKNTRVRRFDPHLGCFRGSWSKRIKDLQRFVSKSGQDVVEAVATTAQRGLDADLG
jgi:Txe/YoeB family toxin of Txe-Axe toxin-antitoxin module